MCKSSVKIIVACRSDVRPDLLSFASFNAASRRKSPGKVPLVSLNPINGYLAIYRPSCCSLLEGSGRPHSAYRSFYFCCCNYYETD